MAFITHASNQPPEKTEKRSLLGLGLALAAAAFVSAAVAGTLVIAEVSAPSSFAIAQDAPDAHARK